MPEIMQSLAADCYCLKNIYPKAAHQNFIVEYFVLQSIKESVYCSNYYNWFTCYDLWILFKVMISMETVAVEMIGFYSTWPVLG